MAKRADRIWEQVELSNGKQLTRAALIMFLAIEDTKRACPPNVDLITAVWRRYCASNLTELEWTRAAFNRNDADANAARAVRELHKDLGLVDYAPTLRIPPTMHYLVAEIRELVTAPMAVDQFIAYCRNTYERVSKLAD